jgi:hypothetical protein
MRSMIRMYTHLCGHNPSPLHNCLHKRNIILWATGLHGPQCRGSGLRPLSYLVGGSGSWPCSSLVQFWLFCRSKFGTGINFFFTRCWDDPLLHTGTGTRITFYSILYYKTGSLRSAQKPDSDPVITKFGSRSGSVQNGSDPQVCWAYRLC